MIVGYLDAGSASLVLQAVLGGAAGTVVAIKAWKARMTGKKAKSESPPNPEKPAVSPES